MLTQLVTEKCKGFDPSYAHQLSDTLLLELIQEHFDLTDISNPDQLIVSFLLLESYRRSADLETNKKISKHLYGKVVY